MKGLKQLNFPAFLTLIALLFVSCDSQSDSATGSFSVWLHDAPADFEEVNIFIERVEVNRNEDEEGWIVISEPMQQFDLLELTNGAYEVLGSAELESGTYSQIRLIVSHDDNYIVENGEQKSLFVPSGSQTGVKLNVDAEITDGSEYVLLLDFDAERSIVQPGQAPQPADYILKPVIRATHLATTGNASGVVVPASARPAIYAISGSDTLSTTYSDEITGEFLLFGLSEGSYTLSFNAREPGFEILNLEEIAITPGEVTTLGEIQIPASE
ncbi:MAG: DUF4382 domain-containing protein [Balneolaceae bacterium]